MRNKATRYITVTAAVAALYIVLTMISSALGLSSGVIQVRISEVLCVLPAFCTAAIPGLFIGCVISNFLSGCILWDVIFGSLATLIAALLTRVTRRNRILSVVWPILSNAAIIPFVLKYAYGVEDAIYFMILTVAAGEFIACGIFGYILYPVFKKFFVKYDLTF